ncbi:hypothetical protein E4K72_22775 [Oxalobacteraceae bacterium OM1]|nr:hypothetical protein E4K72_22775 [Oxalobacteraceae bacterium OM1]
MKRLLILVAMVAGVAHAAEPLDDAALGEVAGQDGIGIGLHLVLNDASASNPVTDSRLMIGFNVEGRTNYIVVKNLRGTVDMLALGIGVHKQPDGSDYVGVDLPANVRFKDFGFESLSVQSDPFAPVTDSLGRVNINGNISMQGQLRLWAH